MKLKLFSFLLKRWYVKLLIVNRHLRETNSAISMKSWPTNGYSYVPVVPISSQHSPSFLLTFKCTSPTTTLTCNSLVWMTRKSIESITRNMMLIQALNMPRSPTTSSVSPVTVTRPMSSITEPTSATSAIYHSPNAATATTI